MSRRPCMPMCRKVESPTTATTPLPSSAEEEGGAETILYQKPHTSGWLQHGGQFKGCGHACSGTVRLPCRRNRRRRFHHDQSEHSFEDSARRAQIYVLHGQDRPLRDQSDDPGSAPRHLRRLARDTRTQGPTTSPVDPVASYESACRIRAAPSSPAS